MKPHLIAPLMLLSPALATSTPLPQALKPYTTSYEQYRQVLAVDFLGIATFITGTTPGTFVFGKSPAQSLRLAFPESELTGYTRVVYLKMASQLAVQCLSLPTNQQKPLHVWLSKQNPEKTTRTWTSGKITATYQNDRNGYWKLTLTRTGTPGKADWKDYCLY